MSENLSVAICICTYRRPRELERLLASLEKLHFADIDEPQISVVVVENDASALAKEVCENYASLSRWPLFYEIELKPGISNARNRCLSLVANGTDFVAFLDDDEIVDREWLEQLLKAQRDYAADFVGGLVLPIYNVPPPEWVIKGNFYVRRRGDTGTQVPACATNNLLVSYPFIRKHHLAFDASLGLSGGSDALFSRSAKRLGAKLVWSNEAIVHEHVPPDRSTKWALLQRSFRVGITDAKIRLRLHGPLRGLAISLWRGTTRFGLGVLFLPFALLGGMGPTMNTLCRSAYGVGALAGGVDYNYNFYRRNE